jgi:hypothetical protein
MRIRFSLPILFLLGMLHPDHLYKVSCNSFYEWNMDVTTLSMQMFSFALHLPYASLHHTLLDFHMYLIVQVTYGRWCVLDPLRSPCLTSLGHPLDMGRPRMVCHVGLHLHLHHRIHWSNSSNCWHPNWAHEDARRKWRTPWGRPPATSLIAGHGFVLLKLHGDSPATLLKVDRPTQGEQVAPHHRIKIRSAILYGVPEDSIRYPATPRLSRSVVGHIYRLTPGQPSGHVGWVLHRLQRASYPAGLMRCKQSEFLDLQQGTYNDYEYYKRFNYLASYNAHHVYTNEKKVELFGNGLSIQLQDHLILFRNLTLCHYKEQAACDLCVTGKWSCRVLRFV